MSQLKRPLVIANWKMNPVTLQEAKTIFTGIKNNSKKFLETTVVIAPPTLYITELKKLTTKTSLALGAQNTHFDVKGAYTGEHSIPQLVEAGVSYVIIGHSERRQQGETDELIGRKVMATLKGKCTAVVCVGEKTRDTQGNFYSLIEQQIKAAVGEVQKSRLKDVVIAYEPIWAIGTGATATVADVMEMQLFIKKILTKLFDRTGARNVRVIYGGSVNADNAKELFISGGINGFLVGGASLKPVDFGKIIQAVN
ncbi:MAG: triose-phosphate isomerase [Patescibacteria group bacterium]